MLEGRTRLAGADGTQEGVETLAVERGESRRVLLVADVGQELARCVFRSKPITDSGRSRSLIPVQTDH